jgi:hypothetical protein
MARDRPPLARLLVSGLAVLLLAGSPAAVAAAETSSAEQYRADLVAVTGRDNALWVRDTGGPWLSLGGYLIDAPTVVLGQHQVFFVGLGRDHNVWIRSETEWWRRFGPVDTWCLGPSAVVSGTQLGVTCRGGDGAVYAARTADPSTGLPSVGSWQRLGGLVKHGAAVSDFSEDGIAPEFLYSAIGNDDAGWYRFHDTWWVRLFAQKCAGALAASEFGEIWACRAPTGRTTVFWFDEASGNIQARDIGGLIKGRPAVSVDPDGVYRVYALGGDDRIWRNDNGAGWHLFGGAGYHGVSAASLTP